MKPTNWTFNLRITVDPEKWAKYFETGYGRKAKSKQELLSEAEESLPKEIMGSMLVHSIPVESIQLHGPDKPIITKEEAQ